MAIPELAPALQEALEEYQEGYMRARNLAERSRVEYTTSVLQFLVFLQKHHVHDLAKVTPGHISEYMAELDRQEVASVTRRKKLIILRTFFGWLKAKGKIAANPARRVIPPYIHQPAPRFLSPQDCQRLLVAVHSPRDKAIIQLLLQTGITLSETAHLTLMDVALPETGSSKTEGLLRVVGKRGKTRMVSLNAVGCEALAAWLQERPPAESSALFLSTKGGSMTWRGIQYLVGRYLEKAGIEGASVHTLRHTFAVQRMAQGVDLDGLQQELGLEDRRSTMPYGELVNKSRRSVYNAA